MEEKDKPAAGPVRRKRLFLLLGALFLLGAAAAGAWIWHRWQYVSTDDAQVKGNLIALSPKVPGRISALHVDEGAAVKKGQLLFELEKNDYRAVKAQAEAARERSRQELAQALAVLALTRERVTQGIGSAEASLREAEEGLRFSREDALLQAERVQKEIEQAEASVRAARAKVLEAGAQLENARREFARAAELFRREFVAETSRDTAETARQVAQSQYQAVLENEGEAKARLELAKANHRSILLKEQTVRMAEQVLRRAKSAFILAEEEKKQIQIQEKNIETLRAKIKEAEAAFELAEIRLQETSVASPISGVVSRRLADRGQLIQPGQPVFVVNDPADKWVVANVEETKIRLVRRGAGAKVRADAFPNLTFQGKVEFIGSAAISEFALLPADNPAGNFIKITHRLPVRISVSDSENRLRPGMMVVVNIETE